MYQWQPVLHTHYSNPMVHHFYILIMLPAFRQVPYQAYRIPYNSYRNYLLHPPFWHDIYMLFWFQLYWYHFPLPDSDSSPSNLSNATNSMYIPSSHSDIATLYVKKPVCFVLRLKTIFPQKSFYHLQVYILYDLNMFQLPVNNNLSASHNGYRPYWMNRYNKKFLHLNYNIYNNTNYIMYEQPNPVHYASAHLV